MTEQAKRQDSAPPGIAPPFREATREVTGYWWLSLVSVLVFGSLFGIIGAVIGVPITAAISVVLDETTASRRRLIAADDVAGEQLA